MLRHDAFTQTEPELLPVLEELRRYEPIFHTQEFGLAAADGDRRMAPDYWEVGASGRRYSRAFILRHLEEKPPVEARRAGWRTSGHALRSLGPDTFLMTYTFQQGDRLTRRATIWRDAPQGWMILFHQGTVIAAGANDDDRPAELVKQWA
jgi:hypothetical protein